MTESPSLTCPLLPSGASQGIVQRSRCWRGGLDERRQHPQTSIRGIREPMQNPTFPTRKILNCKIPPGRKPGPWITTGLKPSNTPCRSPAALPQRIVAQQVHERDNHIHTCEYQHVHVHVWMYNHILYYIVWHNSYITFLQSWPLNGWRCLTRDRDPKLIKNSPSHWTTEFAKGTSYIKVRSLEKVLVHKPILP